MNSSSPRVVIVGCGGIARAYLGAISPAHIVALCDSDTHAARRMSEEFELDAPIFQSLQDALSAQNPDVAIICTPPATHSELVRSALESGVNVLCEKPLALSAREAYGLVDAAYERQLLLRTSAKYRFCRGVESAKALLVSGEAGALRSAYIAFGSPFDFNRSWHADIALSGGGVWMDNGPHALDLARYFAGELQLEFVEDWQVEGELEIEGCIRLRSQKGVPVEIALSWMRSLGKHFAVLQCERGTLEIGWNETVWRPSGGKPRHLAEAYDKVACFAAQWQGFLQNDFRLAPKDGACAVGLIESIYQAPSKMRLPCPSIT